MTTSAAIRPPVRSRRSPGRAGARRPTPRLGTRGQPEESRAAILKAAVAEFAEHGIAGARTDAIARAAQVNKALLYYYFEDKDALYEAVLDHVFSGLRARVMPVLESRLPPRQKMLEYLGAYFDYIAANPRHGCSELQRNISAQSSGSWPIYYGKALRRRNFGR
jgi:AcrR family transcriptional regulator